MSSNKMKKDEAIVLNLLLRNIGSWSCFGQERFGLHFGLLWEFKSSSIFGGTPPKDAAAPPGAEEPKLQSTLHVIASLAKSSSETCRTPSSLFSFVDIVDTAKCTKVEQQRCEHPISCVSVSYASDCSSSASGEVHLRTTIVFDEKSLLSVEWRCWTMEAQEGVML